MPRLKQTWLRVHRWIALSLGWLVALVGLLGAFLVVAQPVDRWLHPQLFRSDTPGSSARAPYEPIRRDLVAAFGEDTTLTFRPPREADDSLWVLVRGPWTGTVYLDPATGREQGRRAEDQSLVDVVFRLHSSLWLKDTGKAILAWLALGYLAMLVTGLVLWWPRRWPPSWTIAWRGGTVRALFDLHRTTGAVLGLLIALSVGTGAFMAWRPIGDALTALTGGTKTMPPKLARGDATRATDPSIDALVATARARFPTDPIGYVQVPAQRDRPVRVRMRLGDDPHPNGLTSVWMDPRSGEVLRVDRWNTLDLGAKAAAVIYPLHTGELGGPVLEAVVAFNGLALATLGVTGTWLWWRRRAQRRAHTRASTRIGETP